MKGVGTMLATIGAIIKIILVILDLFSISISFVNDLTVSLGFTISTGPIQALVFAVVLLMVSTGRVTLREYLVLGLTIIAFAVLIGGLGGLLALLGGVIVILSALG